MPSLIPDFEYDIFISYRQNDNLPSRGHGKPSEPGWVTEFVESLGEELKATMKEAVSVYFDASPHDGLLETHDVDESLKGKLKCLIFIPIISQTYCDPKSFAWQHEFLPFKAMAEKDQFGLKIKLQNGNVSSRILPIRIHELDDVDKRMLEEQLGHLRGIDFVFKASGVNRPITPLDKKEDNANKIVFRDQVNKVANSIKDLVQAAQSPVSKSNVVVSELRTRGKMRKPILWASAILFIALSAAFLVFNFKKNDPAVPDEKKSIAVIPFDNLSSSATNEMLCLSLSEDILTKLASLHELKVPSRISSNSYRNSKKTARIIGEELGVKYILEGSVLVNGEDIRVTAMLVNAQTDEIIWTKPFNRKLADYFKLQGEVAQKVVSSLEINLGNRATAVTDVEEFDLKAYELYKKGLSLLDNGTVGISLNTVPYFEDALKIDSTLYPAWVAIANSYIKVNFFGYTRAQDVKEKLWYALEKARALKSDYPPLVASTATAALNFEFDQKTFLEYNSKAKALDPNNPQVYFDLALYHAVKEEYSESMEMFDKAVELNPAEVQYYDYHRGFVYYLQRNFDKAVELFNHALEVEPGYELALWGLGVTYSQMGEYQKSLDMFHRRPRGTNTNWALANPLVKLGQVEEARKILDYQLTRAKVTFVPPAVIGHIYLALGEKQEACRWLQRQIGDGGIFWLYPVKLDPRLDPIKGESCYKEFEKQIPL